MNDRPDIEEPSNNKARLRRAILAWLPYLALLIGFFYWRFVLHAFPRAQAQVLSDLAARPLQTAFQTLQTILQDLLLVTVGAWSMPFHLDGLFDFSAELSLKTLLIILAAGLFVFTFLRSTRPENIRPDQNFQEGCKRWALQAIAIGLLALTLGGLPSWGMGLPIHLSFPADRFTLSMALGTSLLLAGCIEGIVVTEWKKFLLASLLVALAVGYQYQAGDPYRREWDALRTFFWELKWRAPALEKGTILLTDQLPFTRYTDNSLAGPLNWLYSTADTERGILNPRMDYYIFNLATRPNQAEQLSRPDSPVKVDYRGIRFDGNSTDSLVIYWDRLACLQVLDPRYDTQRVNLPARYYQIMSLSNPDRIQPDSGTNDLTLLGAEPGHNWCYLYQKAALARQSADWSEILRLAETAKAKGYLPMLPAAHAHEYLPFIEAYARSDYGSKAGNYTRNAVQQSSGALVPALCALWRDIQADVQVGSETKVESRKLIRELNCSD